MEYLNFLKERLGERPMQRASKTLFACFPCKERPGTLSRLFSKNRYYFFFEKKSHFFAEKSDFSELFPKKSA